MKYILHTGLHKTGTKFYQHRVFPNLPKEKFVYNPPKLTQLCCDLMKADDDDLTLVLNAIREEKQILSNKHQGKTILISREVLSGNLFALYTDFDVTISRLSKAFPEADVICSLRFQYDWLLSCYRESVHEHHYQKFKAFLGMNQANSQFVSTDYKLFDLNKIVTGMKVHFQEKVHFFFFENFKHDRTKMLEQLAQLLGEHELQVKGDEAGVPNRGYSAFSIYLSIYRYKLFSMLGLSSLLVHRPIRFFGPGSIPSGFQHLSVLPKDKYWHRGFKRDNEEVRSDNYPNLTLAEKIRQVLSWRTFLKKGIDKLFYWDWPLLDNATKKEVVTYFKNQNKQMLEQHHKELKDAPKEYC